MYGRLWCRQTDAVANALPTLYAKKGPAVDLIRNIDIEIAGLCLAGLVLVQLVFELVKHCNITAETPPRVISLDSEIEGEWLDEPDQLAVEALVEGEAIHGH